VNLYLEVDGESKGYRQVKCESKTHELELLISNLMDPIGTVCIPVKYQSALLINFFFGCRSGFSKIINIGIQIKILVIYVLCSLVFLLPHHFFIFFLCKGTVPLKVGVMMPWDDSLGCN
jgi:hypothetical protein